MLLRRRRRVESLGVFREILRAVRRVEALREDDQSRSSLRSLKDLAAGMGKVDGFVRTYTAESVCVWWTW